MIAVPATSEKPSATELRLRTVRGSSDAEIAQLARCVKHPERFDRCCENAVLSHHSVRAYSTLVLASAVKVVACSLRELTIIVI